MARTKRGQAKVPKRYAPIPPNPLILRTHEVAEQILRTELGRQDRRSAAVRSAVEAGVLPPPLNPKARVDCWYFSMAHIEAWLARDRHPSGRAS